MALKLGNGDYISHSTGPYFVAEINTGHFGDLDQARKAIDAAVQAGASCIKFQSWKPESLYTAGYLQQHRIEARMYAKFAIEARDLRELSEYAKSQQIAFSSTPYCPQEVDELLECANVPFIKIASMDITNLVLLRYAARTAFPIVLSTGMAELTEIHAAVKEVRDASSAPLVLLHCTSLYPTSDDLLNLRNILLLEREFPDCFIGFSDHSEGLTASALSVALGAYLVEKHFTLDRTKPGFDNAMALGPEGLKALVENCRLANQMLGSTSRVVSEDELRQRTVMRRSAYSSRAIARGDMFTLENIEFKRPGNGIDPTNLDRLVGRFSRRNIEQGEMLSFADIN